MSVCVAFEQEIGHPDAIADTQRVEELKRRHNSPKRFAPVCAARRRPEQTHARPPGHRVAYFFLKALRAWRAYQSCTGGRNDSPGRIR